MFDKRVIIIGFGIGALLGTSLLGFGIHTPAAEQSIEVPNSVPPTPRKADAYDPLGPAGDVQQTTSFESMVDAVAREQGGKISLNQMAALAEIYARLNGVPPTYRDLPVGRGQLSPGSRPGADSYAALQESMPSMQPTMDSPTGLATNMPARRYRGTSGADYQYDLTNPSDQVRYSVDVNAQLRDSIDPRVEMDRSLGQHGGGVVRE